MVGFPIVRAQKKETEHYTLRIPDNEDLILQIFFKKPFRVLVNNKKIYEIQRGIAKALEASSLEGEFELEVIPANETMCLTSPGFWTSLVTDITKVLELVEEELRLHLDEPKF